MKKTYKIGFFGALIYIIFELLLLFSGYSFHIYTSIIAFGVNSLLLLIIVAYSIISEYKKSNNASFINDIKSGIQTTASYSIIIALFIFSYYRWINPEYPILKREQWIELINDEEHMNKLAQEQIKSNPEFFDGKSEGDLIDMQESNIIDTLEPSKALPITLFSLMLLGIIYSFFITAFNRLILSRL